MSDENECIKRERPDSEVPDAANGVKIEPIESASSSQPPAKKLRANEELDIRFLVSSKEAGAIIGKGGANINHLRKHYKSSVTVPDCPGPERVLSIVSSIDTLGDILKDVISFIDDRAQSKAEHEVELRLLIHTSHAGGIIGKGGQRIKDLREQTKAAIKVFSQCCPLSTERICAIQGNSTVVIDAIKTVLDIILASPIKGPVKLYDPYNFDLYSAPEYGGYIDSGPPGAYRNRGGSGFGGGSGRPGASRMGRRSNGNQSWGNHNMSMHPPPDPWLSNVSRMPYNGPADRRGPPSSQLYSSRSWMSSGDNNRHMSSQPAQSGDQPYWSDVIPNDNPPSMAPSHQVHSSWSSAYHQTPRPEHGPSGDINMIDNADGSASATISVPNNVAGAIIGKGGNRIRIVRRDSGAEISIDSAVGPGNERTITIKGTHQQVHIAHSMLRKRK